MTHEEHDRLTEIRSEIEQLANEAINIIRGTGEEARARAYWYAHIVTACGDSSDYVGGSMCSLQDSIDALEPEDDVNDDEDDEFDRAIDEKMHREMLRGGWQHDKVANV